MSVTNPPGWLQNAGATHTASQMRNYLSGYMAGAVSSASLVSRGGVNGSLGNKLVVTQTGSPSMAVIVRSGVAWVPGSESGSQGAYGVMNDADVTLSVTAAHPTLPRIDIAVFTVQDSQYSGVSNTSLLQVIAGTPAGSPVAPAAPNDSIVLANIAVAAAATQILNANITDKRTFLTAAGGVMVVTSTTRPAAGTVPPGQLIYESDTTNILRTDDGGTSWNLIPTPYQARQILGASVASVTFSSIPSNLRDLTVTWTARGDTAAATADCCIRINGDSGVNYLTEYTQGAGSGTGSAIYTAGAANRFFVGGAAAASATAGIFGHGKVFFPGWDSPHAGNLGMTFNNAVMAGGDLQHVGGGMYTPAGPYTSLTLFPSAGNFIAGSDFQILGWRT